MRNKNSNPTAGKVDALAQVCNRLFTPLKRGANEMRRGEHTLLKQGVWSAHRISLTPLL